MTEIEIGNEDPIIALLLTLLPQLRRFNCYLAHNVDYWLCGVIERAGMIMPSPKPTLFRTLEILSRLEVVSIEHGEPRGPGHLSCFASLPPVKVLYAWNIASHMEPEEGQYEPGHIKYHLEPDESNVIDLALNDCFFSSSVLREILRGIKSLSSFEYSYGAAFDKDYADVYDALCYVDICLEALSLRVLHEINGLLGTFRHFHALKELETDFELLIKFDPVDEARTEQETLASVLPPSIERVVLYCFPMYWLDVQYLLWPPAALV